MCVTLAETSFEFYYATSLSCKNDPKDFKPAMYYELHVIFALWWSKNPFTSTELDQVLENKSIYPWWWRNVAGVILLIIP